MDLDLGSRATAFRDELRGWLEANRPEGVEERDGRRGALRGEGLAAWDSALVAQRLICVGWPQEHGGRGLGGLEVAVLNDEFARAGVPRVTRGMGESLVGPAIILHGTDEQKARFLPRIIDGTDRYCQGFSEPDAGSDLANVQTKAILDGDELIITGQKVWTSWYWDATILFCLCRTDTDAEKHRGISYVLVPLVNADGSKNNVEFRPLKQLTGEAHFAETFLDEARAPLANVIGGLNEGWRTAMVTLGNERGGAATTQHVAFAKELTALTEETRRRGKAKDPLVRQQLAWAYTHVELMRIAGLRLLSSLANEQDPGPGGSINKVFWSEYQRRMAEHAMGIIGADGMLADGRWQATFLGTRCHTIWGGTAEIQRNIIGERVLGLPKEPSAEPGR